MDSTQRLSDVFRSRPAPCVCMRAELKPEGLKKKKRAYLGMHRGGEAAIHRYVVCFALHALTGQEQGLRVSR